MAYPFDWTWNYSNLLQRVYQPSKPQGFKKDQNGESQRCREAHPSVLLPRERQWRRKPHYTGPLATYSFWTENKRWMDWIKAASTSGICKHPKKSCLPTITNFKINLEVPNYEVVWNWNLSRKWRHDGRCDDIIIFPIFIVNSPKILEKTPHVTDDSAKNKSPKKKILESSQSSHELSGRHWGLQKRPKIRRFLFHGGPLEVHDGPLQPSRSAWIMMQQNGASQNVAQTLPFLSEKGSAEWVWSSGHGAWENRGVC